MEKSHVPLKWEQEHPEIGSDHSALCEQPLIQRECSGTIGAVDLLDSLRSKEKGADNAGNHQKQEVGGHDESAIASVFWKAEEKRFDKQTIYRK